MVLVIAYPNDAMPEVLHVQLHTGVPAGKAAPLATGRNIHMEEIPMEMSYSDAVQPLLTNVQVDAFTKHFASIMKDNRDSENNPTPSVVLTTPVVTIGEVEDDLPPVKTERATELQPTLLALLSKNPDNISTPVPAVVDSSHGGLQMQPDVNLACASALKDTALELTRVSEEEREKHGTVALLGPVKEEQLSTSRAGGMGAFQTGESAKALSLGPEPEPVQIGNGWLHEFEIAGVDIAEGKPWLMARTCADQVKEEFGVEVAVKDDARPGDLPLPKDSLWVQLRFHPLPHWKAAETKWFVLAAADRLKSWARHGVCCHRVGYEGPLPPPLTIRDLVKQIAGEEREHLNAIERGSGTMLRLVQVKSEPGGGRPPAAPRVVMKIRGVGFQAVLAAEEQVTRLLQTVAVTYALTDPPETPLPIPIPTPTPTPLAALAAPSTPLTHMGASGEEVRMGERRRSPSPLSSPSAVGGGEGLKRPRADFERSPADGLQEGGAGAPLVDSPGLALPPASGGGAQVLATEVASDSVTTRFLHVYDMAEQGYRSAAGVAAAMQRVLDECLEVSEGLLGRNKSLVTGATLLDAHVCEVEMAHEELVAACVEVMRRDENTFYGLKVEVGPEERWGLPGGTSQKAAVPLPGGAAVAVVAVPSGCSPRDVYNSLHLAIHGLTTAGERERARKVTGGKLICAVKEIRSPSETAHVAFPTAELAERALEWYEQDPTRFNGVVLAPIGWGGRGSRGREKERESRRGILPNPSDRLPPPAREKAKASPQVAPVRLSVGRVGEAKSVVKVGDGAKWSTRERLDPNCTVYVQKLAEHTTQTRIHSCFTQVLIDNSSRAELATAKDRRIVVEVRQVRPFCAFVHLGSEILTSRALDLVRVDSKVFGGMEVKPHKGSRFDHDFESKKGREAGPNDSLPKMNTPLRARLVAPAVGRVYEDEVAGSGGYMKKEVSPPVGEYERGMWKRARLVVEGRGRGSSGFERRGGPVSGGRSWERGGGREQEGEWERERDGRVGGGGGDGFVQLDRSRCLYVDKIPSNMDEVALERVANRWVADFLGGRGSGNVRTVKLLKARNGFVEMKDREVVEALLAVSDREPQGERRRFEGMGVRRASKQ